MKKILFVLIFFCACTTTKVNTPIKTAEKAKTRLCKAGNLNDCQSKCARKQADACIAMGNLILVLEKDLEVTERINRAVTAFKKGCELNSAHACLVLAQLYLEAEVIQDPGMAKFYVEKACDGGDNDACLLLDRLFEMDDQPCDTLQDTANTKERCKKGDNAACVTHGLKWLTGCLSLKGDKSDLSTIHPLSRKRMRAHFAGIFFAMACEGGYSTGCYNLAVLRRRGWGRPQNKLRAIDLYKRACWGGEPRACANLGSMYLLGNGVTKDLEKSFRHYQNGCKQGNVRSCLQTGIAWEIGRGTEKSMSDAAIHYSLACLGDRKLGCYNLARLYSEGNGVPRDKDRAKGLFAKACSHGVQVACKAMLGRR